MKRRKMGGIVPRRVHVDIHPGLCAMDAKETSLGLATYTQWITETKVTMKENLILDAIHYDIEVSDLIQWFVLSFSVSTNLRCKFVNNRTRVA